MRAPTLASAAYVAGNPPDDPAQLPRFLQAELSKLSATLDLLISGHLDKTTVAPLKPREGDLRLADGTLWNPGSGIGVYCYYGSAWHFLG